MSLQELALLALLSITHTTHVLCTTPPASATATAPCSAHFEGAHSHMAHVHSRHKFADYMSQQLEGANSLESKTERTYLTRNLYLGQQLGQGFGAKYMP